MTLILPVFFFLQNCKQEWFHLECVGLEDIPARTTKWYCPDCRKLLPGRDGSDFFYIVLLFFQRLDLVLAV
jgi:hypothetical protein